MTLTAHPEKPEFQQGFCVNCLAELPSDAAHRPWLFCSQLCADYASLVRYWRRASRDGSMDKDPGIEYALRTRIAFLLAGGYDRKARTIPTETRAQVKERDKVCVQCGEPGEEIDHIDGPSNEPENLQLLCKTCHHSKTDSHLIPASEEDREFVRIMFITRILPEAPQQLCDDPSWAIFERSLRAERRALLLGPRPKRPSRSTLRLEDVVFD